MSAKSATATCLRERSAGFRDRAVSKSAADPSARTSQAFRRASKIGTFINLFQPKKKAAADSLTFAVKLPPPKPGRENRRSSTNRGVNSRKSRGSESYDEFPLTINVTLAIHDRMMIKWDPTPGTHVHAFDHRGKCNLFEYPKIILTDAADKPRRPSVVA